MIKMCDKKKMYLLNNYYESVIHALFTVKMSCLLTSFVSLITLIVHDY